MAQRKTAVVSGGAGFLGSHLVDKLLANGYEVTVLDNLSTGFKHNLAHLAGRPGFTFIEHDITLPLPAKIVKAPVDAVINLASPASPPHYQRLAVETLMVGSVGVQNMLELARKHKARFFHSSTSEVYGDPEVHPQVEEYKGSVSCYGPRSMYDEAKRYAEALIYTYREKYGVNTGVVRIFNTYGPRMDPEDGRVVSNFIVQALRGKPLAMYGNGSKTRSFCYVDDLIAGFMKMIESDNEGPINLGNPGEFTIQQLADKVLALTGSTSGTENLPPLRDDPTQRKPDISKAQSLLGWHPTIDLDEGLMRTIEYFRQRVDASAASAAQ